MSTENLWGDLPNYDVTAPPVSILKEQAEKLSEITEGLLIGKVTSANAQRDHLQCTLYIVVPGLSNYQYEVLTAVYPIGSYPISLLPTADGNTIKCADEQEFKENIRLILQSESVKGVLSKLLAHVRAEAQSGEPAGNLSE